ncbi:MAG: hypothetical protein IPI31_00335 [Bacteroidetes bacterium]|nr:hypothetical protein [Bacteroidota bacterium]
MATKVKLRQKKISGERQNLYLDFYPAIAHPKTGELTQREFLKLYLFYKGKHKTANILILSAMLLFGCQREIKITSDLSESNLYGKVKSYREVEYKAITKFGKILKGEINSSKEIFFNKNGNMMEQISNYSDGSLEYKNTYKYDENGNLIEDSSSYWGFNSVSKYLYDEAGNLLQMDYMNTEDSLILRYIYKYDIDGRMAENSSYNSNGELHEKIKYKYDEMGNIVETTSTNPNPLLNDITYYKHDLKGNMLEVNSKYPDGSQNYLNTYEYDEKGNVIKSHKEGIVFHNVTELTFQYEFDKVGNWISMISFKGEVAETLTERTINYY